MAKTLVTNKQYRTCVQAGACEAQEPDCLNSRVRGDEEPAVCVTWYQAKAFSQWAGGRLPSEAEWEYAARSAGKDRKYPWGDEAATCDKAVFLDCAVTSLAAVCSTPAGNTEQGLCDMAGNAYEWVQDRYYDSFQGAPSDGSAWEGPADSCCRTIRGGNWFSGAPYIRTAYRYRIHPSLLGKSLGFRPAR